MPKVNYATWKISFPYICNHCGQLHGTKREYCEKCGRENSLRDIIKMDYRMWRGRY